MHVKWLISLFLLMFVASEAMAGVVVIMRRQAQTAGKYIRVADIARVDGPDAEAREVAMTVLGPAPRRGETREITRWDIESRLFEMGILADVSFSGNSMVMVYADGAAVRQAPAGTVFQKLASVPGTAERAGGAGSFRAQSGSSASGFGSSSSSASAAGRPAKPVPYAYEREDSEEPARRGGMLTGDAKKRVTLEIANYFMERYKSAKGGRDDIEVTANVTSVDGRIPYEAYSLKVEEAAGRIPGNADIRLLVRDTDASPPREVMVAAETEVFGKALVAVRSIPRGESMMADDVAVQRVRMESGRSYLPPNAGSVVGREAKRGFKPGEVILADDAPVGDAVKRGNLVVMKTEGSGWDVQAKVRALGAGAIGDIITVEDITNKSKYPARITGPGSVAVVVRHDPHGVVKKEQ